MRICALKGFSLAPATLEVTSLCHSLSEMEEIITSHSLQKQLLKKSKLNVKYRGVGHHGYNVTVIKSALIKGVRRNYIQLVLWSLRETFLYYILGSMMDDRKATIAAQAFNTNVINRLYIIAVEDCSPRALLASNKCVQDLRHYTDDRMPPHYLMRAGRYLTESPSSRVCSHLRQMCSQGGIYYQWYSLYENEYGATNITVNDRLAIIFERHLKSGRRGKKKNKQELRDVRAMSAYHVLKVYHQLSKMDDSGKLLNKDDKPHTGAAKKKIFDTFWKMCLTVVDNLNPVHERQELVFAINWRCDFFVSKGYFREENLFMMSAVDLLIAAVYDKGLCQCRDLDLIETEDFDWVRDHTLIDPMPRYVFDKHTSTPDPSVSFALESSQVMDGDDDWSPDAWLMAYTFARLDKKDMIYLGAEGLRKYAIANAFAKKEAIDSVKAIPDTFFGKFLVSRAVEDGNLKKLKKIKLEEEAVAAPILPAEHAAGKSLKRATVTEAVTAPILPAAAHETKNATSTVAAPPPTLDAAREAKKMRYIQSYGGVADHLKDLSKLPILRMSDIKGVLQVHNNNSKKAPVVTVRLVEDDSLAVLKLMRKSFGYGNHQNFVQHVKDANLCGFKHVHPTPEARFRGLMLGNFDIIKTDNYQTASMVISKSNDNVYFVTGAVTQCHGEVVDARFSHYIEDEERLATLTNCLELVQIIAFRMLMGVNDTNHSNILIGERGRLYSVDENRVGSMTNDMTLDTKGCRHLRSLLYRRIYHIRLFRKLVEDAMPRWITCAEERRLMMEKIQTLAQNDGISQETVDRIAANASTVGEKLMNFLF